ncbi:MAG: hypothetical protein H0V80_09190 [Acidobacteria bacterium]|nr:hypothetical protein [Acidobacteriota bacterium]
MQRDPGDVTCVASSGALDVYEARTPARPWYQFGRRGAITMRVVDTAGIVRLQRQDAVVRTSSAGVVEEVLRALVTELADFGDAGRTIPDVHLLAGTRVIVLSGLVDDAQMLGLAAVEMREYAPEQPVVIVATRRRG